MRVYKFWAAPKKDGDALTHNTTRVYKLVTDTIDGIAEGIYGNSVSSYNSLRHTLKLAARGSVAGARLGHAVHDCIAGSVILKAQGMAKRGSSVSGSFLLVFVLTGALLAAATVTMLYMTTVVIYCTAVSLLECALSLVSQISASTLGALHSIQHLSSTVYKEEISGIRSHSGDSLTEEQGTSNTNTDDTASVTQDSMFGKKAAKLSRKTSVPAAVFAAIVRMILPILVAVLTIPLVPLGMAAYTFIAGYDLYHEKKEQRARKQDVDKRALLDADAKAQNLGNDSHYERIAVSDDARNFEECLMSLRTSSNPNEKNSEAYISSSISTSSDDSYSPKTLSLSQFHSIESLMEWKTKGTRKRGKSSTSSSVRSSSSDQDKRKHAKKSDKVDTSEGSPSSSTETEQQQKRTTKIPLPPLPKTRGQTPSMVSELQHVWEQRQSASSSRATGTESSSAPSPITAVKTEYRTRAMTPEAVQVHATKQSALVSEHSGGSLQPRRPAPARPTASKSESTVPGKADTEKDRPRKPPSPESSSIIKAADAAKRVDFSAKKSRSGSTSRRSMFQDVKDSILSIESKVRKPDSRPITQKDSAASVSQQPQGRSVDYAAPATEKRETGTKVKPPRPPAPAPTAKRAAVVYENTRGGTGNSEDNAQATASKAIQPAVITDTETEVKTAQRALTSSRSVTPEIMDMTGGNEKQGTKPKKPVPPRPAPPRLVSTSPDSSPPPIRAGATIQNGSVAKPAPVRPPTACVTRPSVAPKPAGFISHTSIMSDAKKAFADSTKSQSVTSKTGQAAQEHGGYSAHGPQKGSVFVQIRKLFCGTSAETAPAVERRQAAVSAPRSASAPPVVMHTSNVDQISPTARNITADVKEGKLQARPKQASTAPSPSQDTVFSVAEARKKFMEAEKSQFPDEKPPAAEYRGKRQTTLKSRVGDVVSTDKTPRSEITTPHTKEIAHTSSRRQSI